MNTVSAVNNEDLIDLQFDTKEKDGEKGSGSSHFKTKNLTKARISMPDIHLKGITENPSDKRV